MFRFLKDKLKKAISKTSEKIEEEGATEEVEEEVRVEEKEEVASEDKAEEIAEEKVDDGQKISKEPFEEKVEKKGFFSRLKGRFSKKEKIEESKEEPFEEEVPEEITEEKASEEHKDPEVDNDEKAAELMDSLEEDAKAQEFEEPDDDKKHVIASEKVDSVPKIEEEKEDDKEPPIINGLDLKESKEEHKEEEVKVEEKPQEEKKVSEEKPAQEVSSDKEEKETEEVTEDDEVKDKKEMVTKEPEEKKGFFTKLKQSFTTKKINDKQFEDIFYELEVILLENNVAVEVIEKIKEDLRKELVDIPLKRDKIEKIITDSLKNSISALFDFNGSSLIEKIKDKGSKPFVIAFLGINGSGKTTTIAKVADMLLKKDLKVVLAAADTFRAAAIDQLTIHSEKLGVKIIKHEYGSDPAAVAFDAIKHAEAKKLDAVLVDTAGRIHSNSNLMAEMKKIIKVSKPDLKIFVGEAITGNDCTEQAKKFDEAVGIDGIILTKADVDEKGGASISVSYVTKKPIYYIGVGQEYSDLKKFDPSLVVESLGL